MKHNTHQVSNKQNAPYCITTPDMHPFHLCAKTTIQQIERYQSQATRKFPGQQSVSTLPIADNLNKQFTDFSNEDA